jgi:MFS family permease
MESPFVNVKRIRRTYYLVHFLFWFSVALPLAISILLVQARGLDLFQIGSALGIYSLTIVLLELPTGGLADAIGRKRVALLAFLTMTLSSLVMLVAFTFPIFLLAWVLHGIGRALSSGALDAWFIDSLQAADPDADLQPALAGAETVGLLALGAGTLLGSALPALFAGLPPDGTAVLTPLSTPIVAATGARLILLLALVLLVQEQLPVGGGSGGLRGSAELWRTGFRAVPGVMRTAVTLSKANRRLVLLMAATFISGFTIISLEAFWQPFFGDLLGRVEGNSVTFGIIMAGNFLVGMAGNLLSIPLSRRLDGRHAMVAAIFRLLQGAFVLALALQFSAIPAVAFFWLIYLAGGVGLSPHLTLVNREIPAAHRSSMLSVQSLASYVGSFLGGSALGYVADHFSIPAAWLIAGALTVLSLGFYLALDRQRMNRNELTRIFAKLRQIGVNSRKFVAK